MEYNINKLREKIDNYFTGVISETELGQWASRAYYDLLKGEYIKCEKIVLYPFLKNISTIHEEENDMEDVFPCPEESVKQIQNIVHGGTDWCFDVEVSFPVQVYTMFKDKPYFNMDRRNVFLEIRDVVSQYSEPEYKFDNLVTCVKKLKCMEYPENTVQSLLEECIFKFIDVLYNGKDIETKKKTGLKLYSQKTIYSSKIEDKLLDYLDSYIGNRNFHLIVSYKGGEPDIFLLV